MPNARDRSQGDPKLLCLIPVPILSQSWGARGEKNKKENRREKWGGEKEEEETKGEERGKTRATAGGKKKREWQRERREQRENNPVFIGTKSTGAALASAGCHRG